MAPVANPVHISSTSPKQIIVTPGFNLTKMNTDALPKYAVGLFENNGSGPRKRKRLTHLTPEEKVMRRKLKNRVAAQTARDRKKAKVDSLEESVAKLRQQTKQLLLLNSRLLKKTEALENENNELRKRLGLKQETQPKLEQDKDELEFIMSDFSSDIKCSYPYASTTSGSSDDDDMSVNITDDYCSTKMEQEDISVEPCKLDKCGSPVPAAFGERPQERIIPPQQEAVHSLKLIHLPTQQNSQKLTLSPSSTLLQKVNVSQTSQKSTKKFPIKIVLPKTSLVPLDLRLR